MVSSKRFMGTTESSAVQIFEGNALTCPWKADTMVCATSRQKGRNAA